MGLPTRERRREPQAVERGQPQEIRDQGPGLRTSSHPYVVTTSASGRRTWSQARARPASSSRSKAPTARPERRRRSVAASSAEPERTVERHERADQEGGGRGVQKKRR
jgi:hypothetical protein